MIFAKLKLHLPVDELQQIAPAAEIHRPQKKDYWPEQWTTMKHFCGAHLREKIAGKELFYQLGFMHDALTSVQINTTGDVTEICYGALNTVGDQIIAANESRGLAVNEAPTMPMPWSELKDKRLSESGLPNDRYIICRSASWREGRVHSYLSIALEWPHVLSLEYREETRDAFNRP